MAAFTTFFSACTQKQENVIAEVNGEKIFAEDFAARYKSYIEQGGQRDNILLRQKILNNMINERLIFADCSRQKFDSDAAYRRRIEQIEGQALLDEYSKRISVDTMTVSEQELQDEFRAFNTKVNARYLYAESEDDAQKLKDALAGGATFDSLAKNVFDDPGLANNGGNLGYFGWSEMEPAFEEAAYTLPLNQVSEPVRLKIGFGIIQVLNRVRNPLVSEMDYAKAKLKLERAIRQKKALRLVSNAGFEIAAELAPQFEAATVQEVFSNWRYISDEKFVQESPAVFQPTLKDLPLVRFVDRSWNVNQFLTRAMKTTNAQRRRVKNEADVRDFVTGLAVREVLLDRARKAGLAEDKDAQLQVKKMRESYLLKRWLLSVSDTVGQAGYPDSLLREQYEKFKKEYAFPPQVNVAEILVSTRQQAEQVAAQLRKGVDFGRLAEKFSLRRSTAKRGGEIGWGTIGTFGNLGQKFMQSKPGAVLGPEFVDPYFGVFKILAKEEGRAKTFDEAKQQAAEVISGGKRLTVAEEAISTLRSRATIVFQNERLANIVIN